MAIYVHFNLAINMDPKAQLGTYYEYTENGKEIELGTTKRIYKERAWFAKHKRLWITNPEFNTDEYMVLE
ncbi:MAG: hypothetical protein GX354_01180 [Firmicutes bacterium]|nr:hypothetical protein [Bacillota bacterium]